MSNECDWLPEEASLGEQIEAAKEHDMVPIIVVFAELSEKEGRKGVNTGHHHFAWGVSEEAVIDLAVLLVHDMFRVMQEEAAERARRN